VKSVVSPHSFTLGPRIFLRVLAVIHAVAFLSFWSQWRGLLGPHGLQPADAYLKAVHDYYGNSAYFQLPTLCWIFGANEFLPLLCAVGVALSLALFVGLAPALCLGLLWVAYLSLISAGQIFYSFQWDALLLETTLLALPLAPWTLRPGWKPIEPPRLARGLLGWLLARLMFLSGAVKLLSGDPTWRDLSALTFHFETQPLPTPVAWYVHQFSPRLLHAMGAVMFALELLAPVALFGPRVLRHAAAISLMLLQAIIVLTGNYTFFNFLTIALCLLCFDDAAWRRLLRRAPVAMAATPGAHSYLATLALRGFAGLVLTVTLLGAIRSFGVRTPPPAPFQALLQAVAPFQSLNNYGLFAVMTHPRTELIIEGSDDDHTWLPYEFPHKPGDLSRRPDFVAPYQPRLDWQLWFAALDTPERNPWVLALCEHLLRGTPEVLELVQKNPFPAHPPRYVRVQRYEYHFTDQAERTRTGHWWRRTLLDTFVPASALNVISP
jgi:hypothetical protein